MAPDAEFHRPVLGVRALHRAGLKVKIDFARATLSVWTPGSWWRSIRLFLRRRPTGFARRPPHDGGGRRAKLHALRATQGMK